MNKHKKYKRQEDNNKKTKPFVINLVIQLCILVMVITSTAIITTMIVAPKESNDYEIDTNVSAAVLEEPEEDVEEIEEFEVPKIFEKSSMQNALEKLAEDNKDVQEILKRADEYPEEILEVLCYEPEDKLIEFVKGYPDAGKKVYGDITKEEMMEEYPLLLQFDKRWGYYPYGKSNIARSGCGPTAISMISVALTGNKDNTPDKVADYAMENGYYIEDQGTAWSLFNRRLNDFGISGQILYVGEDNMKRALDAGHPILVSLGPGKFTKNGHLIVIVGYEKDKYIIRDPGSTKRSQKLWSFKELAPEMLNLWEFSPI